VTRTCLGSPVFSFCVEKAGAMSDLPDVFFFFFFFFFFGEIDDGTMSVGSE
jgi:hypothetical protein